MSVYKEFLETISAMSSSELEQFWAEFNAQESQGPAAAELIEFWENRGDK